jgi:hypothetical protein
MLAGIVPVVGEKISRGGPCPSWDQTVTFLPDLAMSALPLPILEATTAYGRTVLETSAFQSSGGEVSRVLRDNRTTRPASDFDVRMIFTRHRACDHRINLFAGQDAMLDRRVRNRHRNVGMIIDQRRRFAFGGL